MSDVVVIGGGVNGLVAGAWLAQRKRRTIIVEQHDMVGGAAVTAPLGDGCFAPALSHALGPLHPSVARALRLDRAHLDVITPDPSLTVLGRDGAMIVFHRDPVLTAGSIHQVSPGDAARWREFRQTTQRIASVVASLQQQAPPAIDGKPSRELWPLLGVGRRARKLGGRDLARLTRWLPMAVADLAAEFFESDLVQAAIASRAVFGHFAGPWSAGTGAMLLQRLAEDPMPVGSGVTMRGGPGVLTQALANRAKERGAQVRTGARVTGIAVEHGRATGVVLENGETIEARAIVAAIDPKRTLIGLIDPGDLAPTVLERAHNYRTRGVTAKINLVLSSAPVFTALHGDPVPLRGRLLIADDIDYVERAFDAAKYGELSPAPWLEVSVPTTADASLAPDGSHVMSIYVHYAPRNLRGAVWADRRDALYATVMRVLHAHAPGLDALVIAREILTPEDLERRLGASGGHIFHGEQTLDQTWIARPWLGWSQYQGPLPGLFFASAGTHPGGGLTGLSGLLAGRAVDRALR
jgi:phytoene dehydrogenase-like protein